MYVEYSLTWKIALNIIWKSNKMLVFNTWNMLGLAFTLNLVSPFYAMYTFPDFHFKRDKLDSLKLSLISIH